MVELLPDVLPGMKGTDFEPDFLSGLHYVEYKTFVNSLKSVNIIKNNNSKKNCNVFEGGKWVKNHSFMTVFLNFFYD